MEAARLPIEPPDVVEPEFSRAVLVQVPEHLEIVPVVLLLHDGAHVDPRVLPAAEPVGGAVLQPARSREVDVHGIAEAALEHPGTRAADVLDHAVPAELRRQGGGPQGGVVEHHDVVEQQAARVLRNGNAYAVHVARRVLHVVVHISQRREPVVPHALIGRLVQIDALEAHDGPRPGGQHHAPARRVHGVRREDLVRIERQDDARGRNESARVAEQQQLAVPLVEFVGRVVDDSDLGISAADGATVVRRALVGDDDVVRESAGHREEPLEDPRLVADRRDNNDANKVGHGFTIRRRERKGNGARGLRRPNRTRILVQ